MTSRWLAGKAPRLIWSHMATGIIIRYPSLYNDHIFFHRTCNNWLFLQYLIWNCAGPYNMFIMIVNPYLGNSQWSYHYDGHIRPKWNFWHRWNIPGIVFPCGFCFFRSLALVQVQPCCGPLIIQCQRGHKRPLWFGEFLTFCIPLTLS